MSDAGPVPGPDQGADRVRVSRVVYGWAEVGLGHTTGAQYLGATDDLLETVTGEGSAFDRHVGFLGDRTPARIDPDGKGRTAIGLDLIDGRWACFRKAHPENVPDRHIVEFLVAPGGIVVDPALALLWAEQHTWIDDTDRVNPLAPVELPRGGVPEVHMLTVQERGAAAALLAALLTDPSTRVHLHCSPRAAAQLLRAVFLVLPRSMGRGITFSTLETGPSGMQIVAAPFEPPSSEGRVSIDPAQPPESGPPEVIALSAELIERLERGDRSYVGEIREVPAVDWQQLAAADRLMSGRLAEGDLARLALGPGGTELVDRVLSLEGGAEWVLRQVLADSSAGSPPVAEVIRQSFGNLSLEPDGAAGLEGAVVAALVRSSFRYDDRLRVFLWLAGDLVPPERRVELFVPHLGRGLGAPPEVRIDVLRFLFPAGQPEPTRIDHADRWLMVPDTELGVVLRELTSEAGGIGIAPWVASTVLLMSVTSPVARTVPVAALLPEFHHLVLAVAGALGDEGFARWLAQSTDERSAPGVVDWLLAGADLPAARLLSVLRSPAMARSQIGAELMRRKDELLGALLRGSALATSEERRPSGWRSAWR